jgi:hypothetical protein
VQMIVEGTWYCSESSKYEGRYSSHFFKLRCNHHASEATSQSRYSAQHLRDKNHALEAASQSMYSTQHLCDESTLETKRMGERILVDGKEAMNRVSMT